MRNAQKQMPIISTDLLMAIVLSCFFLLPQMPVAAQTEIRKLKVGKAVERELRGGEEHTYEITLKSGQYLDAVVEQRGIDVVVIVMAPDGKLVLEADTPIGAQGPEPVNLIASAAGNYRLIVRPVDKGAAAGRYEMRVAQVRTATAKDRDLQEAIGFLKEVNRLYGAGKYDEAIHLAERALAIREKHLGAEHRDCAEVFDDLAGLYFTKGDYARAEPLFLRALQIDEKVLGSEHSVVATVLNNLALLYMYTNEPEKSEQCLTRALAIREKALGKEHPYVAFTLNDLGMLYMDQKGDYVKGEMFHQRALAIREKVYGKEHPEVAESLHNLGLLYLVKGDYMKARALFQRTLAIREKTIGANHPDTSFTLDFLARTYVAEGDYAKAEPLFQRSLAIREKIYGAEHRDVAYALGNLAKMDYEAGGYAKAEPLFQRALAITEKVFGKEHPDVAPLLNSLALIDQDQGEYAKAEPLFQRALAIREKAYGAEHPYVAQSLSYLARFYQIKGDIPQSLTFRTRANEVRERNFLCNLSAGSERQKLLYVNQFAAELDATLSLHLNLAPNNAGALRLAVTTLLRRKGRALDAMSDTLAALRRHASADDQMLLDQLASRRTALSVLTLKGPGKDGSEKYQASRKALEDEIEKLESAISLRSAEFRTLQTPITLESVQKAIPANAALVEFAIYHPYDAKAQKQEERLGKPRYVAYLLRNQDEPQWVELGDAETINKKVAEFRRVLRDPSSAAAGAKAGSKADVKTIGSQLDKMVMAPLRKLLGSTRHLFLSPDGALNLIPFAALVDEQNQYLVKNYSLTYLTSGRDLLRLHTTATKSQAALVIADPDFDDSTGGDKATAGSETRIAQRVSAADNPAQKGANATPGPKLGDQEFQPLGRLASTVKEAEEIKTLLPEARLLTRREASKAAIQAVSSPAILHIATHGFFLEDEAERQKSLHGARLAVRIHAGDELQPAGKIENPLLRSGLFLAGANAGEDGDGVLTAMEAAGLDLYVTKLVVLSACDTGVGEVLNSDGVYGLRRALVLAGSEAQMISLWSVSDVGTSELMIEYYKALKAGEGRSEALRDVQLKMLKNPKRQHPYYWASFIQSGEWANLDGKR